MKFRKLTASVATAIGLTMGVAGTASAQNPPMPPPKTDFVFIIDATSSMGGEIGGVAAGFSSFVGGLNAANVDARFAVVLFGGSPELVLDFTSDGASAQTALGQISVNGAVGGFQNNHNANPEAGLEAIRMVLGAAPNSVLDSNNIPQDGILNFRQDARKNLILATDEDSDRPFYAVNRQAGQTGSEPSNPLTNPAWQAEVDATAAAVIQNQAFLNMLINVGDFPSASQYGDYNKDVADLDLLNFDPAATLANLNADATTADSLQAQVLTADLIARTFNVAGANDANFVNNFFAAKLEEVVNDPGTTPTIPTVSEPGMLALFGLGLLGLGLANRRRKKA